MSLKDGDQPGEQVRSCVTYAAPDKHSYWHGNRLECFFHISLNLFKTATSASFSARSVLSSHLKSYCCQFLSSLTNVAIFVKSCQCRHAAQKHQRHTYTHKAHMRSSTDKHAHKHKHKPYLRRVSARSSDSLRLSGLLRSKEVSYLSRQYYQQPVNRQADWKYFH